LPQDHQSIRVAKGQWLQQERLDHAEDGAIAANAQRDGDNGKHGKCGLVCQHPKTAANILPDHGNASGSWGEQNQATVSEICGCLVSRKFAFGSSFRWNSKENYL
jgi:hypothetical protein